MAKIIRRKLKKEFKLSLLIMLLILSLIIYKSLGKKQEHKMDDIVDKVDYITDTSETDNEIIETVFVEGMSVDDYKKIHNFTPKEVKSSAKYSKINYDFEKALKYSEVEDLIYQLNNSEIVNTYIIGKSHDNRNIYNVEIGNGEKVLMLDANMHAAESANTPILMKFLIDILNDYEFGNKEVVNWLNTVKIAAIPCINPDGYEVYNFGIESINNKELWIYQNKDTVKFKNFKYNANGVDLNRNFPTQNGGLYYKEYKLLSSVALSKTTNRYTYFGGSTLGSEPEVRAVMYQMISHYKKAYAYINIHSQGRVIYSGKPNLSDEYNEVTINLVNRMANITKYKAHGLSREEVGEGNDGTASDFMAETVNGFIFSSKTGRLSSSSYKNNNAKLLYSVPAIVLETSNDNYKDPKYYKDEYYNHGLKEMFYDLVKYGTE